MIKILKPIHELSEIEVLVFINRWLKSVDVYYEDSDKIYRLKYSKIKDWLISGEFAATGVIKRQNPAFNKIQEVIDNQCSEISYLNRYDMDLPEEVLSLSQLVNNNFEIDTASLRFFC